MARCLAVLCAAMIPVPAPGASNPEAPPAQVIHDLAIDPTTPTTLYAATQDGVYKSTDGGGRWEAARSGLPPVAVVTLALDPRTPGTLYAGTALHGGIYKTENSGGTWTSVLSLGAQSAPVVDPLQPTITLSLGAHSTAIALDPGRPETVYVSTFGGAIYRTADGGRHWVEFRTGLPKGPVLTLAVDPRHTGTLYAGTWAGGVYKTTDGGTTWKEMNTGLGRWTISNLTLDPRLPDTLYTIVGPRMYRTSDGGLRWTQVGQVPGLSAPFRVTMEPRESRTLYVGAARLGVLKTADGGASWQGLAGAIPDPDVTSIVLDPATPTTLYAGTRRSGVYKSMDGGRSWGEINGGLAGSLRVVVLAINSRATRSVYAGTLHGGVLKTTDGGEYWASVSTGLPHNASVHALVLEATSGPLTTLFAGTNDGVYKSSTGGLSWEPASAGLPANTPVAALAFDPRNVKTVYAAAGSAARGGGVFRTTDGGIHWSPLSTGLPDLPLSALIVDPTAPGTLYAGVHGDPNRQKSIGGIYKTVDGGAHWQPANGQLYPYGSVLQLVMDPARPSTLYVSLAHGVLARTTTGGAAWEEIPAEPVARSTVLAVAVDPRKPGTLYAGVKDRGVFKSTDGGTTWRAINAGLGSPEVKSIAIDPTDSAILYAGTAKGGGPRPVYKSTDGGVTWTDGARGAVATATQPAAGGPTGAIPPAADTAEALHRKLARHEERMDQLSQTLQRTLPMDQRGEVVAQQRHWRARRDIACNLFDRSQYPDRWLRAIREDYTKLICLLQVTRTRLGELERAATAGTVPASVPELAARTILGDTRSYAIREAVGSSSTHGKWYYEAGVHRGAVARVAETALALGFVGYRNFGGHLLDIRSGDADRGILWLGFALDADTGKVYTSINGAWIRGAPGSAEGMDVEAPSAYSAIVAADVPINQLLSPDVIDVNLGERPFVSQMPDRYRPVRVRQ